MSDFLGRRTTLLVSSTLFFAFSLAAGFAQSMSQLIVFRAFQGVGASGLYSFAILIMVEVSTSKTLPWVGGMIGGVIAFSGVLGPVIGGLPTLCELEMDILDYVGVACLTIPTSYSLINSLPVGSPSAPMSFFGMLCFGLALPRGFYAHRQKSRSVQTFDFIGSALLLAALVLFVLGLQQGGIGAFAWNSAVVVATLTIGCVSWVVLFVWEWTLCRKSTNIVAPILPLSILARRTLAASLL